VVCFYVVFGVGYVIWYRTKCLYIYKCNINYFNFRDIINIRYLCVYEDEDADDADADDTFFALNSDHEIFFTAGGFA
jgi:hypothetical protein